MWEEPLQDENTCVPPDTNGEFTSSDITALNFIY
ncbi:M57 family metalloprotease [Pyxidicoccus trucidator]